MRPNILIFMTDQEQADVVHPDHPVYHAQRYEVSTGGGSF